MFLAKQKRFCAWPVFLCVGAIGGDLLLGSWLQTPRSKLRVTTTKIRFIALLPASVSAAEGPMLEACVPAIDDYTRAQKRQKGLGWSRTMKARAIERRSLSS